MVGERCSRWIAGSQSFDGDDGSKGVDGDVDFGEAGSKSVDGDDDLVCIQRAFVSVCWNTCLLRLMFPFLNVTKKE